MPEQRFLCSLNKKHTQEEICSFEIDVMVYPGEDKDSDLIKRRAVISAIDSNKLPAEYKNFSGDEYWMDAVAL